MERHHYRLEGVGRGMLVDGMGVQTEWDRLAVVAVVRPECFVLTEPINLTQRRFYGTADQPSTTALVVQHGRVVELFVAQGIRVVEIVPASDLLLQFNVRDAAVVVGSQLVMSRMARLVRNREPDSLAATLGVQPELAIPAGRLEGGDVMVTPSEVFVGLGERTDEAGYTSLRGTWQEDGGAVIVDTGHLLLQVMGGSAAAAGALKEISSPRGAGRIRPPEQRVGRRHGPVGAGRSTRTPPPRRLSLLRP